MSKGLIAATWDDVPHLSDDEKAEQLSSIPEYQRDARTKGVPYLGAGAIYPFDPKDITVKDFDVPKHWPRGFGMDVGWNRTTAAWVAHDRDTDELYIYSVHSRGHAEPPVHAAAIASRGIWIPGRIDPAALQSNQIDGKELYKIYKKLKLNLLLAPNAVEAGIYACTMRFGTGRLKVFASCSAWFEEYSNYIRDENGKVVKENDHLMDSTRYVVLAIDNSANWLRTEPVEEEERPRYVDVGVAKDDTEWLGM